MKKFREIRRVSRLRGNINIRAFLRPRLTVAIHAAINLVGIHYNRRTIKFDPEQTISLSLAVPGAERRFFQELRRIDAR